MIAGSCVLVFTLYVAQHHPVWIPPPLRGWTEAPASAFPHLSQFSWIILGLILVYVYRLLGRI